MTVSYSKLVANGSSFGCFWRILYKWRGSVYKLVWRELLVFLVLYFAINLLYRYGLDTTQQRQFERIRAYFGSHTESIPMSFVLGFYVSLVVKRWWEQYRLLPWPDTLALFVSAAIPGVDERGRLMRRNIVRYAVLAYVITLQHVSLRVKKRFPSWQHMVDAGFMMESEKKIFELMDGKSPMSKYWMPLVWATNIINRARKESLIQSDHVVQTMLQELSDIRRRLGSLIGYDTVCVPLVYTQVVTLSVYTYFTAQLMGRQFVMRVDEGDPDIFFPLFTALQFCFYIGWLKVAEVLINPFGEDDDDIELNWLIDRHIKNIERVAANRPLLEEVPCPLQPLFSLLPCLAPDPTEQQHPSDQLPQREKPWPFAAYMIVDEMHEEHPELLKDQYWDEVVPKDLPYTVASECYRRAEPKGSAEDYKVKESDALYANLLPQRKLGPDDVYADYESVDTPLVERRKNWFQRQLQRMGSVRSSSTTYSTTGVVFGGRPRHNSVYSQISFVQGENGGLPGPGGVPGGQLMVQGQTQAAGQGQGHAQGQGQGLQHKMSLYDRLVGRRSSRQNRRSAVLKNRPRIPTPDVTRDVRDSLGVTMGVAGAPPQMQINAHPGPPPAPSATAMLQPQSYADMPVVQVLLTPIQEAEGGQTGTLHHGVHSVHSVHSVHGSGTKALAQAVLSPALQSAGLGSVTLTTPVSMAMSPVSFTHQPILLSASPAPARATAPTVTLTEVSSQAGSHSGSHSGSEEDSGACSSSGSVNLDADERKVHTAPSTNTSTAERKTSTSSKRGEVYV